MNIFTKVIEGFFIISLIAIVVITSRYLELKQELEHYKHAFDFQYQKNVSIEDDQDNLAAELEAFQFYYLADPDLPLPIELTANIHELLTDFQQAEPS